MKRTSSQTAEDWTAFREGRDSIQLAEFPLALLADSVPEGQKTIEFSDTIDDWKSGATIERRVIVTGSDRFGLPTAKDEDVLLALMQLTKLANNFSSPEVEFTKHQVIAILGWSNRGWAYDRVEESLHRWKGVSIHYSNAWRDHKNGVWRNSEAIGVIEYFNLTDGRRSSSVAGNDRSRFVWNKVLFESFAAGYLKQLDFEIYRKLERPASKRAFRFLDKRFFHRPDWDFDLRVFACEKVGLSRNYDTGKLKSKLQPAMDELTKIGFIEPVRYVKRAKKQWRIAVAQQRPPAKPTPTIESEPTLVVQTLVARGVGPETAAELVAQFPTERIVEKLRLLEWHERPNSRRAPQNPAGFLVSAIRRDFRLPKGIVRDSKRGTATNSTGECKNAPAKRSTPTEIAGSTAKPLSDKGISPDNDDHSLETWWQGLDATSQVKLLGKLSRKLSPFEAETYARLEKRGGKLFDEFRFSLVRRFLKAGVTEGQSA